LTVLFSGCILTPLVSRNRQCGMEQRASPALVAGFLFQARKDAGELIDGESMPSPRVQTITDIQHGSAESLRGLMGVFPFGRTMSLKLTPVSFRLHTAQYSSAASVICRWKLPAAERSPPLDFLSLSVPQHRISS